MSAYLGGGEGLSNIPYMIPFFINCQVSYYLTYYFHDIGYPIIYPIVTFAYRKVKKYPINNSSVQSHFLIKPNWRLGKFVLWLELSWGFDSSSK